MQTIKMKKATPGHLEGEVRRVDERSAAVLIERGDAEAHDGEVDAGGFGTTNVSRAGFVTQIAEADPPPDVARRALDEADTKAELVELAKGKLTDPDTGAVLTDSEVGKLTKAELKSRLGGPEGESLGGVGTAAIAGAGDGGTSSGGTSAGPGTAAGSV